MGREIEGRAGVEPHKPNKSIIPQIVGIDQLEVMLPRYVWLDEDEEQVSPIHKEFRAAMQFISNWQGQWDAAVAKHGFPTREDLTDRYLPFRQLTKSGKAPTHLKRIVIKIEMEEPSQQEIEQSQVMLQFIKRGRK